MQMDQPDGEVIAMPGLRSRMAAYQQNTTNKKKHGGTGKREKKKRPGKLQEKLLDPGKFESPFAAAKPQKPVFQVEPDEGFLENSDDGADNPKNSSDALLNQPRPQSPLRRQKPLVNGSHNAIDNHSH